MLADRSVLVTGAEGFTGAWLVQRLLQDRARVLAPRGHASRGSRFRDEGLEGLCELVELDLNDLTSAIRVLDEHQVELVFHLAAHTVVEEADRSPMQTFQTNVRGTYNLLEACRIAQAHGAERRIVIASSSHVYGMQAQTAYSEEADLRPTDPYDVSKACADLIARCYATTYEMPVAVTRLANIYGGGDRNWSRVVPDTARALARGDRPVIRSDGAPEREYIYVEDAVDVYLTVAESLESPRFRGRAWNAGTGTPISVLELVKRLIGVAGKDVEPEIRGTGTSDVEVDRLQIDSTAIREELGWSPRWSLDEGLAKAYAWYERDAAGQTAHALAG
jgi:CDP-glucose 4,6-dehydratase